MLSDNMKSQTDVLFSVEKDGNLMELRKRKLMMATSITLQKRSTTSQK